MWQIYTDKLSYFMVHYPRGQVAAKRLLGEDAEYVVVTDQYARYHYIAQQKRQLCWAHILRNVSALAQSWGPNVAIGKRLETIVNMLFRTRHRFENGDITEPIYQRRMLRLQRAWREVLADRSRLCITPRYRNRCALLLKHDVMCWTFLTNQGIPLTNNEAERSLRSYVLWRKGSYGVWSHLGELFRQRILTIVESCRKLGANPLEWLRDIVRSVIEKSSYPSLPELDALSQ
jgi:transposase